MKVYGEGLINDRAVEIDLPIYDFKGRNERRPSDPDDKILKRILKQNLRQSTRDIVKRLNTSQSIVYLYLKKLGKVSKNKE